MLSVTLANLIDHLKRQMRLNLQLVSIVHRELNGLQNDSCITGIPNSRNAFIPGAFHLLNNTPLSSFPVKNVVTRNIIKELSNSGTSNLVWLLLLLCPS